VRARRRSILIAAALLVLVTLACYGSGMGDAEYDAYGLDSFPPYWVCASATPRPSPTPDCQCMCMEEPGLDECAGPYPSWCSLPSQRRALNCSNPGPHPTPTLFTMTGGPFHWHQRVWIPMRPTSMPVDTTDGGTPLPPQPGTIGLMLMGFGHLGGPCFRYDFEVRNISQSPIDFDLPAQTFMRCKENNKIYTVELDRLPGDEYPNSHFGPGEIRGISVPICYEGCPSDPLLGVMTTGYQSEAGTAGLNASTYTGGDTAIYIDWLSKVPGECSVTQEPEGFYPEIENPPAQPNSYRGYAGAMGMFGNAYVGHSNGDTPVTIPPCLRITRGFGCSGFPTGVAGGSRCPSDQPYWHTGVDYSCYEGTPVFTPMSGALLHSTGTGYGNLARVILSEHGQTIQMYFAHLSSFAQSDFCHVRGMCNSGSKVGEIGSTGFSTGPHLHWEIRVNNVPVDPFQYWSAVPEGGARGPVAGVEPVDMASGGGVLAAPALVPDLRMTPVVTGTPPPPTRYPLRIRVRRADGSPLASVEIILSDSEGKDVAGACTTGNSGDCEVDLPTGVYQVRLGGEIDGHPIDPVGDVNVEAMESGIEEYYFGPLAVWHDPPHSTSGFVLSMDEDGVLQPLMDADPTGDMPQPVNPMDHLSHDEPLIPGAEGAIAGTTKLPGQAQSSAPTLALSPTVKPEDGSTDPTARIVGILLFVGGLGMAIAAAYLLSRIRKERPR